MNEEQELDKRCDEEYSKLSIKTLYHRRNFVENSLKTDDSKSLLFHNKMLERLNKAIKIKEIM